MPQNNSTGEMSPDQIKQRIEEEVRKMMTKGMPEFIARIKAASLVMSQVGQVPDRREAMATHCNEV